MVEYSGKCPILSSTVGKLSVSRQQFQSAKRPPRLRHLSPVQSRASDSIPLGAWWHSATKYG